MNRRGVPTWSGAELQLWRRALSVSQGDVAERLAMNYPAVSVLYESRRAPVVQSYSRVVKYMEAVERAATANARDAADALAALEAVRATAPTEFVDAPHGPEPSVRTAAEADAILHAQGRTGEL